MNSFVSLSTIQKNQINSICKVCSNALLLIDEITAEWFQLINAFSFLFSLPNRPTIKKLDEPEIFDSNRHENLVIILSEPTTIERLKKLLDGKCFRSIFLLTSSGSIFSNENEKFEEIFQFSQEKFLQFPFVTISEFCFLAPSLIPFSLPPIELLVSLSSEKIKNLNKLNEIFESEQIRTIRVHAELLDSFMTSLDAREEVFVVGPLSHLIAREYSQMDVVKHRRKSGEQKIALLLIDRHLDLPTASSRQQETLFGQMINVLNNVRLTSSDSFHQRTVDVRVDTKPLLKNPSTKYENDLKSFLISDVTRETDDPDVKSTFENLLYAKAKVGTSEIFTRLLESLIYNNLETKIKPMKVSAAAISACLEKFRQNPISVCKSYELLVMSCALMQLLDSTSKVQMFERLSGLEKILVQALGANAGPSPFSIVLQTLKDDLKKTEDQRQLKLLDYVLMLIHIYSLAGDDVFYGKEEKDRTHKILSKEIVGESTFSESLRDQMTTLGFGLEIEQVLEKIYEKLDLILSYKRRFKLFNSLMVDGNDEQPNFRQSLIKQILEFYKRCVTTNRPELVQQLTNDIEHVPFEGLKDFFKSAARGFFGDSKISLTSPEFSTIVIFFVGGVTAHEIQIVHEFSQQLKKQIILGSSAIIKPEDVLSLIVR